MSSIVDSSDEELYRRSPHAPPPPFKAKSSKKKKPVPPQESINKVWSRFSVPRPSKAISILPFATPPSRTSFDPAKALPVLKPKAENLLVSEDFERAVEECRRRVQKLIKECKRVNMRYRDSEFDIDWDLKWDKGYCLNGLVRAKFDLSSKALQSITSNVPKAVKRVHEIFDKPTFLMKEKVSPAEIKQGSLGDCWLVASLTALANMKIGIQRICVEYDTKIGIYGFVFHRDGEWIISIIDDKLYLTSPDWDSPSVQRHLLEQIDREDVEKEYRKTYQTGSQSLFFAQCKDQNETWLPLLEKAYAKAHGDYAALAGGWIGEGVEDLTGGVTTELLTSDILDTDEFWTNEILKVNKEFLFGCSTGLLDGGYGTRDGISEGHAYVIMEARELKDKTRLVKLRNPWGKGKKGNWEGAWSDGSKEFTPEIQLELNHKFGNDSVFWISYEDLLRKYQHFDRTRLFLDCPDWRITHKWISVDVPWKADFEQKFRIVLKKESDVVLVLSQLDNRYWEGLQGQYSFRLQFRLHEVNFLGENDYIVRSHGNYLMERSVVTELKALPAGTYSVFVMVIADRRLHEDSVEDVVRSQCKDKSGNEKLAQVGLSYDLAHSKGLPYIESKTAAQKKLDKAKAREARCALRKKSWEKRHLMRKLTRKQGKKNQEKKEKAEAKAEAKAKEKEEKEPKDKSVQTDEHAVLAVSEANSTETAVKDEGAESAESSQTVVPATSSPGTLGFDINEFDKGVQTDDTFSRFGSNCTPETPKSSSRSASPRPDFTRRSTGVALQSPPAHVSDPSLPPVHTTFSHERPRIKERQLRKDSLVSHPGPDRRNYSRGPNQERSQQYVMVSDGESSASPMSDLDNIYSDNDPTLKPRQIQHNGAPKKGKRSDSEDEDDMEPWNAVCIVGFRVYSKDEGLELKVFEEDDDGILEVEKEDGGTDGDIEDDEEEGDEKKDRKEKEGEGESQASEESSRKMTKEGESIVAIEDCFS